MRDVVARCEEGFNAQITTHQNKIDKMTLKVEQLQDMLSIMESLNDKKDDIISKKDAQIEKLQQEMTSLQQQRQQPQQRQQHTTRLTPPHPKESIQLKGLRAEENEDSRPNKTVSLFVKKFVSKIPKESSLIARTEEKETQTDVELELQVCQASGMEPEVCQASPMELEVCPAFDAEPEVSQASPMELQVCQPFGMEPEVCQAVETKHEVCQVAEEPEAYPVDASQSGEAELEVCLVDEESEACQTESELEVQELSVSMCPNTPKASDTCESKATPSSLTTIKGNAKPQTFDIPTQTSITSLSASSLIPIHEAISFIEPIYHHSPTDEIAIVDEDTLKELPELVHEQKEDTYVPYSESIRQPFPFSFMVNRYTVFCTIMYFMVQLNV